MRGVADGELGSAEFLLGVRGTWGALAAGSAFFAVDPAEEKVEEEVQGKNENGEVNSKRHGGSHSKDDGVPT